MVSPLEKNRVLLNANTARPLGQRGVKLWAFSRLELKSAIREEREI